MRIYGLLLTIMLMSLVSCATPPVHNAIAGSVELQADTSLIVRDQGNAGVVVDVNIKNRSAVPLCIPVRFLQIEEWPFVVNDESGREVRPQREMETDTFGRFNEAFYLVGSGKALSRKIYLRGYLDVPIGTAFQFEWAGRAYECEKVAAVAGYFDEVEKLSALALKARAGLPRQ